MPTETRVTGPRDAAERLAILGLSYLARQPEALGRFLALSGIGPDTLRQSATDPAFLTGVLDFLLGEEPILVAFAADAGIKPASVAHARRVLAHRPEGGET
ncbi:MAG TPA: DUF3572 domain-containing protein [Bauldia sp.]|nr:DUF3572 domain-containing protein [Bauldia sp.]